MNNEWGTAHMHSQWGPVSFASPRSLSRGLCSLRAHAPTTLLFKLVRATQLNSIPEIKAHVNRDYLLTRTTQKI